MRAGIAGRLCKVVVIAMLAVSGLAATSVVAFAYPPPTAHHSLDCDPGHVKPGGTCTLKFKDKDKNDRPRAGQQVCFTVQGPGTVTPQCSTTNSKGVATATYHATDSDCGKGKNHDDERRATITGREFGAGDEAGVARTVVVIKCDNDKDKDKDHDKDGPKATTVSTHGGKKNTAAPVGLTAADAVPAVAILAVVVMLSVAITGRLRLRRLRR